MVLQFTLAALFCLPASIPLILQANPVTIVAERSDDEQSTIAT